MQARITLKTPDALRDAIERMVEDELGRSEDPDEDAELDIQFDELVKKHMRLAEKWFRYGEMVTIVIDFDDNTCVVEKN